jgi:FkbM family methyltransferase
MVASYRLPDANLEHNLMLFDRVCEHTFIRDILSPRSLVIDLGMNKGNFSYEIQRKYGCKIIGVEPNPVLCCNIIQSERLHCYNYAITNEVGEVDFYIDEADSESSSIYLKTGSKIKIPSITLSHLIDDPKGLEVDLLKIDIEGAELLIFDEIDHQILWNIKQITIEFHGFIWPNQIQIIRKVIKKLRHADFYAIDFSRNLSNVLFINQRIIPLTALAKARMILYKYQSGLVRMFQGDARVR